MAELNENHDVDIHWRSFELRPRGAPPITPEYKARIEAGRPRLNAIAREYYGLELFPGPWGIDSRPALVGAKYAELQGKGAAYHKAIFEAYWLEGRSIAEPDVLRNVAEAVGLAGDEFMEAIESPELDMLVSADVNHARSYGLNGVPALVFADKYLVSGAQPYDALVDVLKQVQENEANA